MRQYIDRTDALNRAMPVNADLQLGTAINEIIAAYNDLRARYVALLAKMDLDAGITDTDYAATVAPTEAALALLNDRP